MEFFLRRFKIYWHYMWKIVTPMMCILILVATWWEYKPMKYDEYEYPNWANVVGWAVSMVSVSCIPIGVIYKLYNAEGTLPEVRTKNIFILM